LASGKGQLARDIASVSREVLLILQMHNKSVGKDINLELAEETNVIDGLTWSFIA